MINDVDILNDLFLPGNSEDGSIGDVTGGTSDNDSLGLARGGCHGSSGNRGQGLK